MSGQHRKSIEPAYAILIVVENRNFHRTAPCNELPELYFENTCAIKQAAEKTAACSGAYAPAQNL
jgi:hypothetical protein